MPRSDAHRAADARYNEKRQAEKKRVGLVLTLAEYERLQALLLEGESVTHGIKRLLFDRVTP